MEICPHCVAAGVTASLTGYAYYKSYFQTLWFRLRGKKHD